MRAKGQSWVVPSNTVTSNNHGRTSKDVSAPGKIHGVRGGRPQMVV